MLINQYLLHTGPGHWLVDLDVYRNAGVSNLIGRPVYAAVTAPPQLLPFTYPPIASVLAVGLAFVSFAVAGWIWTVVQFAVLAAITWWLFGPVALRTGRWWPLALAAIWTGVGFMLPVSDGFKYGQVDLFLMALVLMDLTGRRGRLSQGVLIGIATAIKLTPGIFIVHLLVTRQWRTAATAVVSAAGCTALAFVLVPDASFAFWGGVLQDSSRLGPNAGTPNQSLRGILLRAGWESPVLWLALAAIVAVGGLILAARAHRRRLIWHEIALVGIVGLLVSPVSWIHHFVWVVVAVAAFAATRRWWLAGATWLLYFLPLPWWGQWRLQQGLDFPASSSGNPWWSLLNDSYGLIAVLLLVALGRALPAHRPVATPDSRPAGSSAESPVAGPPVGSQSPSR